jgi:hypothetical protein
MLVYQKQPWVGCIMLGYRHLVSINGLVSSVGYHLDRIQAIE